MAKPANAFSTYTAIGIREDLKDLIKDISWVDTPYYSSLGEVGVNQTKVEWQTDALGDIAANAHVEGDAETADAVTPTSRIYNMCQIQKKSFILTNTEEKVKKAGRSSEKNYQTAKKGKELSRDVEYAFLKGVRADGDATTARGMRGCFNWIVTNLSKAADAILAASGAVTGGTARDLTETILLDALEDAFIQGGRPSLAYVPPAQKRVISAWSNVGNYRTAVENAKLNATVDVYMSDFGAIKFQLHRGMTTTTTTDGVLALDYQDAMIILDPAHKGNRGTLRNTHREQLGVTGDNQSWIMRVEHTLHGIEEGAHVRITNLSTS